MQRLDKLFIKHHRNNNNFLLKGDQGMKDAYYQFQDLLDNFSASPLLLNGLAVYNLKTDKFDEAQSALQESLEKVFYYTSLDII